MTPAIRLDGVSKQYRLGANHNGAYRTLRESLSESARKSWNRLRGKNPSLADAESRHDTIWALKDVSFEVQPGEVVGIIGRNGAGKSTLLKILSRITEPTSGHVEMRGRIASLLEVGTGFHQELTGRENIYLNGAILGMGRREIQRKFDEIVAFAQIEPFIDTPVKRYSSGMYVRLAFAVAAHLETEILIVDEVLAVGDAAFQKKCLDKMHAISHAGRTVLFVSHNMAAVESLCTRGVFLQDGCVGLLGSDHDVIERYITSFRESEIKDGWTMISPVRATALSARIIAARVRSLTSASSGVGFRQPFGLDVLCHSARLLECPALGVGIDRVAGPRVTTLHTASGMQINGPRHGLLRFSCHVPQQTLAPGEYTVKLSFENNGHTLHVQEDALHFSIRLSDDQLPPSHRGVVVFPQQWTLSGVQQSNHGQIDLPREVLAQLKAMTNGHY